MTGQTKKNPKESSFPDFKVVLWICQDINGDILQAIDEQLLPVDFLETIKKEFIDYIKDIHNQENVLIILDGLDELPKTSEHDVDRLLFIFLKVPMISEITKAVPTTSKNSQRCS